MAAESSIEKLRLFVAILIPEAVRDEIVRVQSELKPLAPPGAVRWTKPEQIHLTLKFLGNVPSPALDALKQSLIESCCGIPSFRLTARCIGFFPNDRSPRVVWTGLDCPEITLTDLQSRVETMVRPFSEMPGAEKFVAHATLGRFKNPHHPEIKKLLQHAHSLRERDFGSWSVTEINLMWSELLPTGSRYTSLASVRLA